MDLGDASGANNESVSRGLRLNGWRPFTDAIYSSMIPRLSANVTALLSSGPALRQRNRKGRLQSAARRLRRAWQRWVFHVRSATGSQATIARETMSGWAQCFRRVAAPALRRCWHFAAASTRSTGSVQL